MAGRSFRLFVAFISAWLGLFQCTASAAPITYDFSVSAPSGPLAGTTANGTLTFDSSSIASFPPGYNFATGLLTGLNFTWDGITYNAGTANTGALVFDAAGDLITALFGTNCAANSCTLPAGQEAWVVCGGINCFGAGYFAYRVSGVEGFFEGTATLGPQVSVLEPGTIALLGVGLAALGFSSRRKNT